MKKMLLTRLLACVLALLCAAVILVGCNDKDDDGGKGSEPAADSLGITQALSADSFSFSLTVSKDVQYDGKSSGTPLYYGASTHDLFYTKGELTLTMDHGGTPYSQVVDLRNFSVSTTVAVTASTDTVTEGMTYSVSAAEQRALIERIVAYSNGVITSDKDDRKETVDSASTLYDFRSAVEQLVAKVYPYTPETYPTFVAECEQIMTAEVIREKLNALTNNVTGELTLGKDLVTASAPDSKTVTVTEADILSADHHSLPALYSYISYDRFGKLLDNVKGREIRFFPQKADLEGLGLTLHDEYGVLFDEAFLAVFTEGVTLPRSIEVDPFQHVKKDYTIVYRIDPEKLGKYEVYFSDIPSPEVEFDFENGFAYDITYRIGQKTVSAVFHSHKSYFVLSSADCEFLPDMIKQYGDFSNGMNSYTMSATVKAPDSVSLSPLTSPVNETAYQNALRQLRFVFTYGDRTTVLTGDNTNSYGNRTGSYFDYLLNDKLRVDLNGGSSYYYRLSELSEPSRGFTIQNAPYTIPGEIQVERKTYDVSLSLTLEPYYVSLSLDKSAIGTEYYVGDPLSIQQNTNIFVNYYIEFGNFQLQNLETPLIDTLISGFDTRTAGEKTMLVTLGTLREEIPYTVKADAVVSIAPEVGFFDTYILMAPPDLSRSYLTATYESGKEVSHIPVTAEMLSQLPTVPGTGNITVTYEGVSLSRAVTALEVEEVTLYSGIYSTYMLNEKPKEITVKVTFKENEFGYDYDYVILPPEEYADFPTAQAGTYTWRYTFGGKELAVSYEVLAKIYLGYTATDGEHVIIAGLYSDNTGDHLLYYELTSCARIEIPATIDGMTVTEISAGAFIDFNMIEEIILPDTIRSIGNSAFRNMTALRSINIPNSVTALGTEILNGCTALRELSVPGLYPYDYYFKATNPTFPAEPITLIINEGTTALAEGFIRNNKGYTVARMHLPASLTDMGLVDFYDFMSLSAVAEITVAENGYYSIDKGILFADNGRILYYFPMTKQASVFMIPDGVETVVFMGGNPYLNEIYIPASVTTLYPEVFRENTALSSVAFGGSLTEIPYGCFMMCEALTSLQLPTGLIRIGGYAFDRVAVEALVLPDTVTEIGENAFYMTKIKKLAIPASAMASFAQLGDQLMTELTEFAYDGSVQLRDLAALGGRRALTAVYIYGTDTFAGGITYTTYANYHVYVCAEVTSITHPGGVVSESSGCTFHYEGSRSNLTNSFGIRFAEYDASFTKFFA